MVKLNCHQQFDTAFEAGTVDENRLSWISVGGTFDVMHKGHWFLLEETFKVGERAIVGITSDEFVASMK
ncbi:MAG: adenylyltransferase/cytidyltransferase family protein, partial [Candidatus Bathyarchaeia archaeon]